MPCTDDRQCNAGGQWCDPVRLVCVRISGDASTDSGGADGGVDAGADAGPDAGLDAGSDAGFDAGPPLMPLDCQDVLDLGLSTGDGVYSIDPDGPGSGQPAFDAFCDMSTDGGGWTLVYAYTFTMYPSFSSGGNAVTPIPSWPQSSAFTYVTVSTTPPSSLTDFGALDYSRWPELGTSFLIRSNISDTVACDEAGGSFVNGVNGAISCRKLSFISGMCPGAVPNSFISAAGGRRGPSLNAGGFYYYWDGTTDGNWPTHDPCGVNAANHLMGVAMPRGAVLLRR